YYWFERATGTAQLVTDGKSRFESFLPSNAGNRFAWASTSRDGKDFDIYVLDGFDGRTVKRTRECEGQWSALDWSAGDDKLLLHHYVSIEESYLFAHDLATGQSAPINEQPGKKINYGAAVFARKGASIYYTSDEDSQFLRLIQYTGDKKDVISP